MIKKKTNWIKVCRLQSRDVKYFFLNCFSWLYTEHRKDRVQKEQKEPEAMMNHKNEEATDYNLKATNPRIMDAPKSAQKTEMMNGIDNTAFESEQLWSHDLRDPFF